MTNMGGSGQGRASARSAPRLAPGYLRRDRLIAQLDAALGSSVILVHAPAGGGKTNLVADWVNLRADGRTTVWTRLERSTKTADRLWAASGRAFRAHADHAPGTAHELAAALNADGADVSLVIDDFQHASHEMQRDVMKFAGMLHTGRIVLLTRSLDPHLLALARVQLHLSMLTAQDLAYTEPEIANLIATRVIPSDAGHQRDATTIRDVTGGIPILVRLLLDADVEPHQQGWGRAIDAWVSELVSDEYRDAALRLSLVPGADLALAQNVTGYESPERLLDMLERDGLGRMDRHGYFEFHDGIRSAFQNQAREVLPDATIHELRVAATQYLRNDANQVARALELLTESGRAGDLWPLFAATFADTLPEGAGASLSSMLPSSLSADGTAATITAVIQSAREPTPSIALLGLVNEALADLESRPAATDPESAVYHELAILALLRAAKRHVDGANRAQRLLELTGALDPHSTTGVWDAAYWGLLYSTVTLALAGDLVQAEEILPALGADHDQRRITRGIAQRAFIHANRGEIGSAASLLDQVGDDLSGFAPWEGRLEITRAAVQLEHGDARQAQATLRAIEPQLHEVLEWPYALIVLSRTHLALDPVAGIEDLDRLMRIHGQRPISPGVLDLLNSAMGDLALAAGDVQRAIRTVGKPCESDIAQRLTVARIGLITRNPDTVADLRKLTQQEGVWPRLRAPAFLLLAVHLHRQGDAQHAGRALKRALTITSGQKIRLIHSLIPYSELQAIASEAGLELPANVNDTNPLELPLAAIVLTARESLLLRRLASPDRLRDIAEQEYVTLHTIKSQASSIYRKLGVRSRQAAVHEAYQRGLLED